MGALGAFSFLWGENDELFGKHICGGILSPAVRTVGLKEQRSTRLFHMRGCMFDMTLLTFNFGTSVNHRK